MCEVDFGETCEFWRVSHHRAAKTHRCSCCRGPINKGELYAKEFSIFEGEPDSSRWCFACDVARTAYGEEHRLYPHASQLAEDLDGCYENSDSRRDAAKWRLLAAGIRKRNREAREVSR